MLQQLEHPCLVKLHEWFVHDGKLCLIMDLLAGELGIGGVHKRGGPTPAAPRGCISLAGFDMVLVPHCCFNPSITAILAPYLHLQAASCWTRWRSMGP